MNTILKKVVSLILCFVLVIGYVPTSAIATETGETVTTETTGESSEETEAPSESTELLAELSELTDDSDEEEKSEKELKKEEKEAEKAAKEEEKESKKETESSTEPSTEATTPATEETVPVTEETVPVTEETVPVTEATVPETTEATVPETTEETVPETTVETRPGLMMMAAAPKTVSAYTAPEEYEVVDAAVIFSDLHTSSKDYKQDEIEAVMTALQGTGLPISSVTSGGDAFSVNEDSSWSNGPYTGYTSTITGYIQGVLPEVPVNYVWSDHDRCAVQSDDATLLDKTSRVVFDNDNYYIYALSMGDLCSYDRYKAGFNYTATDNSGRVAAGFTPTVEEAIANFKAAAAAMDKNRPLLIVSHQPLFDNRNDNAWAEAWFDAINEVAAEMDVFFFYGHNHKYNDASGADYYYGKGSSMPVATADNWNWDYDVGEGYLPSMDLTSESKVLNFTHLCGGYLEPTSTSTSSQGSNTRVGTLVVAVLCENDAGEQIVNLVTYDANGEYTGNYAVNEVVECEFDKTVTQPETPPETPAETEKKDEITGITVKAPGLSALNVQSVDVPAAAAELFENGAVAYDITVEGFVNESGTATVTLPIPSGMDAAKFVVYHVPTEGAPVKMNGTASADGTAYTFTTSHFSTYVGGETRAVDAPVINNWVTITPPSGGTTTYTYTQATSITGGQRYVIVANNHEIALHGTTSLGTQSVDISGTTMTSNTALTEWTFSQNSNGTSYESMSIGNGSRYLRYSGSSFNLNSSSAATLYVSDQGDIFRIRNDGTRYFYYNGSSWTRSSSNSAQSVRLYQFTNSTTSGGSNGLYGAIVGDTKYSVEQGTSWESAKAVVQDGITIYYTDNVNATTGTVYGDNDAGMTWTCSGYDANTLGDYAVTIAYEGVTLGTVTVSVVDKVASSVVVKSTAITVERDTSAEETKVAVEVTYDGNVETVYLPLSMLEGGLDLSKNGTYSDLTITYLGFTAKEKVTVTVVNKTGANINDFPTYPNPGSVDLTKNAAPLDQDTGLTRVELTASGLPYAQGVDVIVMLDMSSSMDRCITCGEYTSNWTNRTDACTCSTSVSRVDELVKAMSSLEAELKKSTNSENIKIAIADFNGVTTSGPADYTDSGCSNTTQDVGALTSGSTAKVYTGSHQLNADAFISAKNLNVASFTNTASTNTYKYAPSTGTNYDYAFDAVYQLGYAIKQYNKANNQADRKLFVIFMSDGAANQFNYYNTTGGRSGTPGTADWDAWLTGNVGAGKDYSFAEIINCQTHKYYFDATTGNQHRMANAIKGNPNINYEIIRKNQGAGESGVDAVTSALIPLTQQDANYGKDNMYKLPGLGATTYTAAFYVTNDGNISADSAKHSLKGTATSEEHYIDAAKPDALADAFAKIGGQIAYAASNAAFVDQMGDAFKLQMATTVDTSAKDANGNTIQATGKDTSITVSISDIYTEEDFEANKCSKEDIGKPYGTDTAIETVKFNADGTVATSDAKTEADGNILNDGVICAANFFYNTTATTKKVTLKNGKTYDLPAETFYWDIGLINKKQYTLSYMVYLEGSMEGTRVAGNYATNNYAKLNYVNWVGNDVTQSVPTPTVSWKEAKVSYAFYLVDSNGNPLTADGNQAENFLTAYKVTQPVVHQSILLNSDEGSSVLNFDVINKDVLPDGYEMYDDAASYQVVVNSGTGGGSWTITKGTDKATTYVTGYLGTNDYSKDLISNSSADTGNDYNYADTTVWFAVVYKIGVLNDTVVIDYGLPVDISVLANDMLGTIGKLEGVAAMANKPTDASTNALATGYSSSVQGTYGTATVNGSEVTYTPGSMSMNSFDKFSYAASHTATDKNTTKYYYGDVTVIPATTVYYEDNFLKLTGYEGAQWNQGAAPTEKQDEDRPGQYTLGTIDANNIYGYDGAYTNLATHSMDSAAQVHLTTGQYATAEFTFYGTGFDVVSVSSSDTGAIAVQVSSGSTFNANDLKRNTLVNTYYGMDKNGEISVNEPAALYQVPVIKIEDLPYGQYTVCITATYSKFMDKTEADGYDLYLDAIRIYDPAGDQYGKTDDADGVTGNLINGTIQDAYISDGEGWPTYIELRDHIMNAAGVTATVDKFGKVTVSFPEGAEDNMDAVFIDCKDDNTSIADYVSYGPNNELYLAENQAVAFSLDLKDMTNIADVQIGLKVGNNNTVDYKVYDAKIITDVTNAPTKTLNTTTDMYYSIKEHASGNIVITNVGGGILSITNIKITYKQDPNGTAATDLMMDEEGAGIVLMSLRRAPVVEEEIPETTVPDASVPETTVPDVSVPETTAPEETEPEETKPQITPEQVTETVQKVVKAIANALNSLFGKWFR